MIHLGNPIVNKEMQSEFIRTFKEENFLQGPSVEKFEKEFSEFIGTKYAIAVNSGTSALTIALRANGIHKGDKVITTPASFIATTNAILMAGAEPIFSDINQFDFNLDLDQLRISLENSPHQVKAILPVHLYGKAINRRKLKDICSDFNLILIEDCAQSIGASDVNEMTGSYGDAGCFSFYPTKNMTVCGDGGMITTNSKRISEKTKVLRDVRIGNLHPEIRYTARMHSALAAIGRIQLKYIEIWNSRRQHLAKFYNKLLFDIPEIKNLPEIEFFDNSHVFYCYTLLLESKEIRSEFMNYLKSSGIETKIHYPVPIYKFPYVQKLIGNIFLKKTEEWANGIVSIPMHPKLEMEDILFISETIKEFFKERRKDDA